MIYGNTCSCIVICIIFDNLFIDDNINCSELQLMLMLIPTNWNCH